MEEKIVKKIIELHVLRCQMKITPKEFKEQTSDILLVYKSIKP